MNKDMVVALQVVNKEMVVALELVHKEMAAWELVALHKDSDPT